MRGGQLLPGSSSTNQRDTHRISQRSYCWRKGSMERRRRRMGHGYGLDGMPSFDELLAVRRCSWLHLRGHGRRREGPPLLSTSHRHASRFRYRRKIGRHEPRHGPAGLKGPAGFLLILGLLLQQLAQGLGAGLLQQSAELGVAAGTRGEVIPIRLTKRTDQGIAMLLANTTIRITMTAV